MAISLNLQSKSGVDLTLQSKSTSKTWEDAVETWNEATYTWANPKLVLNKVSKSKVSLNLQTK